MFPDTSKIRAFRLSGLLLGSAFVALLGLGQLANPSGGAGAGEPSVSSTPYNRLQFKFSHNSYERDEQIEDQLTYDPVQKYQAGCRGLEFDCHQDKERTRPTDAWRWSVHHDGGYSPGSPQLEDFLARVHNWSARHPGHDPIAVYVELKDAAGSDSLFVRKFDELLLIKLGGGRREKFFTPRDMLQRGRAFGAGNDLVTAAQKAGWPALGELRDRFIVVITGDDGDLADSGNVTGRRKERYASDPATRIAFVDRDCGEGQLDRFPDTRSGDRLFLNIHVYHDNSAWHDFCRRAGATRAFITRGWKVDAEPLWEDCLKYGLNMLATDKIRNHPWAAVGGTGPFRIRS